jgi:hypothetical protein
MHISQLHPYRAVTEQIANGVERNTLLYQTRGKMTAQIMPAKLRDHGASEERRRHRLESCGHLKDTLFTADLLCATPDNDSYITANMAALPNYADGARPGAGPHERSQS